MRFVGLTLCLLASSLGARAASMEDRVSALEARVKVLEEALRAQGGALTLSTGVDGTYTGAVNGNGPMLTLELSNGKAVATLDKKSKSGTYKQDGRRLTVDIDNDPITFEIVGNHLKSEKGTEKIDLVKAAPAGNGAAPVTIDGRFKATMPNGEVVTVEFDKGKVVASSGNESKTGIYEIIGQRVLVTADGKTETLVIDGGHLRGNDGKNPIDFTRSK